MPPVADARRWFLHARGTVLPAPSGSHLSAHLWHMVEGSQHSTDIAECTCFCELRTAPREQNDIVPSACTAAWFSKRFPMKRPRSSTHFVQCCCWDLPDPESRFLDSASGKRPYAGDPDVGTLLGSKLRFRVWRARGLREGCEEEESKHTHPQPPPLVHPKTSPGVLHARLSCRAVLGLQREHGEVAVHLRKGRAGLSA